MSLDNSKFVMPKSVEIKIDNAIMMCGRGNTASGNIIKSGISIIGRPISEIESVMEKTANVEIAEMEKGLGYLGLISGIAPILGFIGTIALILVAGGIFAHNIDYFHHFLPQIPATLKEVILGVFEQHPDEVSRFKAGENQLTGFFMGQIMKASGGKADPKTTNALLRELIQTV